MLVFISFIVLFASAFFWPHARVKNDDLNSKSNHRNNLKNSKTRSRRKQAKKQPLATQTSPNSQQDGAEGGT
jgi:Flp pilus assembly protein TadB